MAQLLIDAKAPLNASVHPLYTTPLHTHQNNPAIVHLLLTHNANVHAPDYQRKTPLHDCNSIESITELVTANTALDARDREDNTILHSYTLSAQVLNHLLTFDTHALINSRNIHGSTPLHHLAWGTDALHETQWNNAEALELLIARGAVVDAQDLDNNTPLHNARHGANDHKRDWNCLDNAWCRFTCNMCRNYT